jgi:hypothetical protein
MTRSFGFQDSCGMIKLTFANKGTLVVPFLNGGYELNARALSVLSFETSVRGELTLASVHPRFAQLLGRVNQRSRCKGM